MDGLIEASSVMAGVTVFVLLAVISMFGGRRRRRDDYPHERFVPGNYEPHAHHHGHFGGGDGWGGHH